jgi:aminoglycoside phosphotransferase (APT) family kinase protein
VVIDDALVRALLREQFPRWAGLDIRAVQPGGWDNRAFRLGHELVVRLPSSAHYASQPAMEHRWLPVLAPRLPLEIPRPAALGQPGCGYPWPWIVHEWIEGDVVSARDAALGRELGAFLSTMHRVDAAGGPQPGARNFQRGADVSVYGGEVRRAMVILEGRVDELAVEALWTKAAQNRWSREPVWVHGDIAPGNLIERAGRLAGVIDFGNLAIGDPACDLAVAWTWLDGDARRDFRAALDLDEATWVRGRAWALWKALVVAAGLSPTAAIEFAAPLDVVERCLA